MCPIIVAGALMGSGQISKARALLKRALREARDRDDRYGVAWLGAQVHLEWLPIDGPGRASEQLESVLDDWRPDFDYIRWGATCVFGPQILFYEARGREAWENLERNWDSILNSVLTLVPQFRLVSFYGRAQAALLAIACGEKGDHLWQAVDDALREIADIDSDNVESALRLIRAEMMDLQGEKDAAIEAYRQAVDRENLVVGACTRRRLGQLIGGDEGKTLIEQAEAFLRSEDIVNAAAYMRIWVPASVRDQ